MRIVVLCGGVGAARFLSGLVRVRRPEDVTAIVNVADDETFHGLHVSPDLDTVLYTLAGIVDEARGWGIRGDTYRCGETLRALGAETWFQLGDLDLATHIRRSELLGAGQPLSQVTAALARALSVRTRILPVSDGRQATMVRTPAGWLAFQEYFVKRATADAVLELRFEGEVAPAPGVLDAIASAETVVLAPSNPFVSIGPILAVAGLRDALRDATAPIVAVSPIVGGAAIKGPAAAMLASLDHEVSPVGVAALYADFLDAMVIDERDRALAPRVAALGVRPVVAPTLMSDATARERLARDVLAATAASG